MVFLRNAEGQYSKQIDLMGTVGNKSIDLLVIRSIPSNSTIPMQALRSLRSIVLVGWLFLAGLFLVNISPSPAIEVTSEETNPNIANLSSNISIATAWKNVANDENACIDRSKIALQNAGFQNINVVNQSISGDLGQYKGTVRCAASEKIAFFVVAGSNTDTAFRRVSEIYDNF